MVVGRVFITQGVRYEHIEHGSTPIHLLSSPNQHSTDCSLLSSFLMRRSFSGTTGSGSPISDIDALRNSVFSEIEVLRKRIQILERESPGAKSALSVEGGSYRRQVVNPKSGAAAGARAQKGDALENEDAGGCIPVRCGSKLI